MASSSPPAGKALYVVTKVLLLTIFVLRWDGRAVISHVDDKISHKCTLQHAEISDLSSSTNLFQLRILGKHTAGELVREVAWSPDSKKLATLTEKAVRIWNVEV